MDEIIRPSNPQGVFEHSKKSEALKEKCLAISEKLKKSAQRIRPLFTPWAKAEKTPVMAEAAAVAAPASLPQPAAGPGQPVGLTGTEEPSGRLRNIGERVAKAVGNHPVSPMLYAAVAALVAGALVFHANYMDAYTVSVDGVEVGMVADTADMEAALSSAQSRIQSITGTDYTMDAQITYNHVYTTQEELSDMGEIEDYLYNTAASTAIMDGWVLTVGDQEIGLGATEEDLQAVLDRISAAYITENTVDYGFVEDVSITSRQMSADTEFDMDGIYDALTANTIEQSVRVVQDGETFGRIATSLDMTVDELSALNPDVDIDHVWTGDELVIQQAVPALSVWTVDNETYEESIPFTREYEKTDDLYEGETEISQEGEEGISEINADVKYVNGYETERTVLSTTTTKEPVNTIIQVGTKEKPAPVKETKTAATARSYTSSSAKSTTSSSTSAASSVRYAWPVSGSISSRYGYRSSGFHSGLDIVVPTGTTVKAAAAGTVTFAGWSGGYGNLVIITHDDGSQTYYAHNSGFLVSAGTRVSQGQGVALSGSTGNSTGPHCHFEVRINGQTQNPLNYLS